MLTSGAEESTVNKRVYEKITAAGRTGAILSKVAAVYSKIARIAYEAEEIFILRWKQVLNLFRSVGEIGQPA
jgi:hypothetical protein